MTDMLVWAVIRQDDNGNRYRVGCYATREEAERIAEALDEGGLGQLYVIERIDDLQST
jgi:cell division protein FtsN